MVPQLRKIILFTVLLVLALAIVHVYVQFLLRKCPQGNIAKVNAVMLHKLNAEITIWGASTARVHFDTPMMEEKLQMSCFNVGLDGTPFAQYAGLLHEYIRYADESKLLVLAIDINGFGDRNALYQGYAWLHYINNEQMFKVIKSIDEDLALKSRYIPLYYLTTYDRRFLIRCLKWVYMGSDGEPELDNAGFHANNVPWQINQHRPLDKPFEVVIEKSIVDNIRDVIGEAVKKRMQVAVVVPPCYIEATKYMINRSEFEGTLKLLECENVRVFNYLDSPISYNKINFSNNTHLDSSGAALFTSVFIEDVRNWINNGTQH